MFLVFLEQRGGTVKKASLEAACKAADLAKATGTTAIGLLIGGDGTPGGEALLCGLEKVICIGSGDLAEYSGAAYAQLTADTAKANGATALVFSHTAMGRDLAPRVTALLDGGIVTDCTAVTASGGDLTFTRPVFAGKALQDVKLLTSVKVLTLRPNVFPVQLAATPSPVEQQPAGGITVTERVTAIKKTEGKLDVAEASVIVSGGRGMKAPEHFTLIEEAAGLLRGAVGASRAVVDAGWRPHSEQVGQTGKTVSPSLYVAVGISGAIQHLAGMSSSKYIVAINKDKDAPIFSVADYGIAGDAFEVLPALIDELKKLKA